MAISTISNQSTKKKREDGHPSSELKGHFPLGVLPLHQSGASLTKNVYGSGYLDFGWHLGGVMLRIICIHTQHYFRKHLKPMKITRQADKDDHCMLF